MNNGNILKAPIMPVPELRNQQIDLQSLKSEYQRNIERRGTWNPVTQEVEDE